LFYYHYYRAPSSTQQPQCATPSPPHGSELGLPVEFVHIPKAGGTSINMILENHAKKRDYFALHYLDQDMMLANHWDCPDQMKSQGIFFGHRQLGFCRRFVSIPNRQVVLITSLREPISRLVSEFDYIMRNQKGFPIATQNWQNKTLSELVLIAADVRKHKTTFQTRSVADQFTAGKMFEMSRIQSLLLTTGMAV
jgi:hypothetical protein